MISGFPACSNLHYNNLYSSRPALWLDWSSSRLRLKDRVFAHALECKCRSRCIAAPFDIHLQIITAAACLRSAEVIDYLSLTFVRHEALRNLWRASIAQTRRKWTAQRSQNNQTLQLSEEQRRVYLRAKSYFCSVFLSTSFCHLSGMTPMLVLFSLWQQVVWGGRGCWDAKLKETFRCSGVRLSPHFSSAIPRYITNWMLTCGAQRRAGKTRDTCGYQCGIPDFSIHFHLAVFCWTTV